jgi:hypothetical protein
MPGTARPGEFRLRRKKAEGPCSPGQEPSWLAVRIGRFFNLLVQRPTAVNAYRAGSAGNFRGLSA